MSFYKKDLNSEVGSKKLVHAVKKFEILYNCNLQNYRNNLAKESIWEKVHAILYPNYNELPNRKKLIIRNLVRRRWKCLRSHFVKTIRTNVYRRGANQTLTEMEFLLPFIRSNNNRVGRNSSLTFSGDDANSVVNEADDNDEGYFTYHKHTFKVEGDESSKSIDCNDGILYPTIHMTTETNDSCNENCMPETTDWGNGYCVTDFRNFRDCETVDMTYESNQIQQQQRTHSPYREPPDYQSKILEILNKIDRKDEIDEECDEDRMFLLSLVSDLRKISSAKKMLVKAEIVTAIARGQQ